MQKKRPDLSSLNNIPLSETHTHYEVRRHESTGMINLHTTQKASKPSLFQRILGKKVG